MRYCAGCKGIFYPLFCIDSVFICSDCKKQGKTKEEVEKEFNRQIAEIEARR